MFATEEHSTFCLLAEPRQQRKSFPNLLTVILKVVAPYPQTGDLKSHDQLCDYALIVKIVIVRGSQEFLLNKTPVACIINVL